jgi:hypothetical protein
VRKMSGDAFRFLRMHEGAHVLLSHVDCHDLNRAAPPQVERRADCWAAERLWTTEIGRYAVVAIISLFAISEEPANGSHPPGPARARYLTDFRNGRPCLPAGGDSDATALTSSWNLSR